MSYNYQYSDIKKNLADRGFDLLINEEDFKGVTLTKLTCLDSDGYLVDVVYDRVMRGTTIPVVHISNPHSIHNINHYLKLNHIPFECISTEYNGKKDELNFRCLNCGEVVTSKWDSISRKGESRNHLVCPMCGKKNESLHASVLKQIFLHEYPDTIVEDPSYINPSTNKIRPTDIVNHRLKIAIEVQSQWHDFEDIKQKDDEKKQFWVNKGYSFYALDIRDYTVLQMCQLFFDIDSLPDYIDYHYSDGINAQLIQKHLDDGMDIPSIAKLLGISSHQIHDAAKTGKIHYPEFYKNNTRKPVIQRDLDGNIIATYHSISEACRKIGGYASNLREHLRNGSPKYKNYLWEYVN